MSKKEEVKKRCECYDNHVFGLRCSCPCHNVYYEEPNKKEVKKDE